MKINSIKEVESYLYNLPVQTRDAKSRLEHVKEVLTSLGSPQNYAPAIHIAGTSGKGSTSYYASSLLANSGYKVGLIVSPHVHTVKERAQINGEPLSDEAYLRYFNQFTETVQSIDLSYIEFLVVFAFWLFEQLKVDYIVVEVGIGGRLDATNVLSRKHTVRGITDIGFDHTEILGDTLSAIASEKAGIIHRGDSVLMNPQTEEVSSVIKATAADTNADLTIIEDSPVLSLENIPLYQQRNWRLAHAVTAERLKLDAKPPLTNSALSESLKTKIPGRFERKSIDGTNVTLDAAHNPQKIQALIDSLQNDNQHKKPIFVVAFGSNKRSSVRESLLLLESVAAHVVLTEFSLDFSSIHASIKAPVLKGLSKNTTFTVEPKLEQALKIALNYARRNETYIVITGSFYLLDATYPLLSSSSPTS